MAVVPDDGCGKQFTVDDPLITGHSGTILDLSFSPFLDNVLATASADGTVKVWVIPEDGLGNADMVEGQQHADLRGHQNNVMLAKWNPAADFTIASASADMTIKVWDVMNQKNTLNYQLSAHPSSLQWSYDGDLIGALT